MEAVCVINEKKIKGTVVIQEDLINKNVIISVNLSEFHQVYTDFIFMNMEIYEKVVLVYVSIIILKIKTMVVLMIKIDMLVI